MYLENVDPARSRTWNFWFVNSDFVRPEGEQNVLKYQRLIHWATGSHQPSCEGYEYRMQFSLCPPWLEIWMHVCCIGGAYLLICVPNVGKLEKMCYTSRFVRVILAQGPC